MKKFKSFLPLAISLLSTTVLASIIIVGTLTTVNNTTSYSSTNTLSGYSVPGENFSITNAGLSATTALTVTRQISVDGTNWITVDTWTPSTTNPANATWNSSPAAPPVYERLAIITTNSVQIGINRN